MPKVTEALRSTWLQDRRQMLEEREYTQSGEKRSPDDIVIQDFDIDVLDILLALPVGTKFDAQVIAETERLRRERAAQNKTKEIGVTTNQNETEDERIERLVTEKIGAMFGGTPLGPGAQNPGAQNIPPGFLGHAQVQPTPVDSEEVEELLNEIDPRDSDSAIKLFNWLVDNARLNKVATLDKGGYLFVYQEPKGSSREGWMAGGTQGDRIVDDALQAAQQNGVKALKGLCTKCYSPVIKTGESSPPEAEMPRPGTDPRECPEGGAHEFAS